MGIDWLPRLRLSHIEFSVGALEPAFGEKSLLSVSIDLQKRDDPVDICIGRCRIELEHDGPHDLRIFNERRRGIPHVPAHPGRLFKGVAAFVTPVFMLV